MTTDINEWLKNNKPTVLPIGFTKFPDGVIPRCKKRQVPNLKPEPVREEIIKEKNKQIRKVKNVQHLANIIKEQKHILGDLYNDYGIGAINTVADHFDLDRRYVLNMRLDSQKARMGEKTWVKVKAFIQKTTFEKPQPKVKEVKEPSRQTLVRQARAEAVANGQHVFMAPCAKHGMTNFFLHNNASRCFKCRRGATKQYRDMHRDAMTRDKAQRAEFNRNAMKAENKSGIFIFTGLCDLHGYTDFKGHTEGARYSCKTCRKISTDKFNSKRRAKRENKAGN